MPNPYSLANIGNFAYPGPGHTPTPARGTGFQSPLGPANLPLPPLPPKPDMPFMSPPLDQPVPEMPDLPSGGGAGVNPLAAGIRFKGGQIPNLGAEGALSGLQGINYPELERIKNAHMIAQQGLHGGFNGGANDLAAANAIEQNVMQSPQMAQQNAQVQMAQQALAAQHPAVAGLAEKSALQKAYPQQAEAYGRIKSADISAEGGVQEHMLDSKQRAMESEQKTQPAAIQAIYELMKLGVIEGLSPEMQKQIQDFLRMNVGILQRPHNRGGL